MIIKRIVKQLSWGTHHLLPSVAEYMKHIGKRTTIARQLRTLIEFYVKRRQTTLARQSYTLAMRAVNLEETTKVC